MFIDRTNLRRRMATIGAAALMATMVAGAADAQTVIKLGWPTSDTETDPYAIMARTFADVSSTWVSSPSRSMTSCNTSSLSTPRPTPDPAGRGAFLV